MSLCGHMFPFSGINTYKWHYWLINTYKCLILKEIFLKHYTICFLISIVGEMSIKNKTWHYRIVLLAIQSYVFISFLITLKVYGIVFFILSYHKNILCSYFLQVVIIFCCPYPLPTFTAAAAAKSLQSCPTLCDPIDSSPSGSPIPGILQARTLECLPLPSPMHESEKWKWSRSIVSDS